MRRTLCWLLFMAFSLAASPALAHFGIILPDRNLVEKSDPKIVNLKFMFWHPMENQGLELSRPAEAGCLVAGQKIDLLPSLKEWKLEGHAAWKASLPIKKPGDYVFYLTPQPYWEPAEDKFIIHYTKTVVSALNMQEFACRIDG